MTKPAVLHHSVTFGRNRSTRLLYSLVALLVAVLLASCVMVALPQLVGVGAGNVLSQQLVVIDTDPGVDDAVAILTTLGDPRVKVLGITCVRGNTDVPNVVINTLKILMIARRNEVPVYTGFNSGLIESPNSGDWFGSDGLGDVAFPNPPSANQAQQEHAASFLARIVKEYPGEVMVIAIGPLTNIALAIHLNPFFLQQARRVVVLGGSIRGHGNMGAGLEFNFYMDPDAAAFVLQRCLSSGTYITLLPMETCTDYSLTNDWRWNIMTKINNSVVSFLNSLEKKQLEVHPNPVYSPFDLYTVGVWLSPGFVTATKELYGFVENRGERSRGALMVDYMNVTGNTANIEVVMEVNTTSLMKTAFENLLNFS